MNETAAIGLGKAQTLDDVMIAMDVVDTLRHREECVLRFENRRPIDFLIYVHARNA